MNENDRWIIDKFDKLSDEVKELSKMVSSINSRISKLEGRIAGYAAGAAFLSTIVMQIGKLIIQ